jgi:uncharacterized protein (TIGR00255 family)
MLRSMTGYGEAVVEASDFVLGVDVRTVNNRFLKVSSKIPEEIGYLQNDLEEAVRARLERGSVFFTVRFEPTRYSDLYYVDEEVIRKYVESIRKLGADIGASPGDGAGTVHIQDLLLLPGAIRTEETLVLGKDKVLPAALTAIHRALDAVLAMRQAEGRSLTQDLRERRERLSRHLELIKAAAPRALEEHFHRIEDKVRKLLGDQQAALSPSDVLKEAAILAERSDICEEIARMESHLEQFSEALESGEPVGRKLEFIVQEMLRESNTMGAKVANSELNRHIVEIKAEVDRLKEQVVNIE